MRRTILGNKKGMFFSIMVFALIVLVLFNYKITYRTNILEEGKSDYGRIDSINKFIEDITKDFNRALYIAGYRAILGVNEYITREGNFVNNTAFTTAIINGTINSETINITAKDHLNDWRTAIYVLSDDFRIKSNITFLEIKEYQTDPWNIIFEATAHFEVYDELNTSIFKFNYTAVASIGILEFEDPTYNIFTNGTFIGTIKKSDYELSQLVNGTNYTRLLNAIDNVEYFSDNESPSYLNRIFGNMSANENGILSFVNIDEFDSKFVYNRSCSDHIYWTNSQPSFEVVDVTDMLSWFRLDNNNIIKLGLTKK